MPQQDVWTLEIEMCTVVVQARHTSDMEEQTLLDESSGGTGKVCQLLDCAMPQQDVWTLVIEMCTVVV